MTRSSKRKQDESYEMLFKKPKQETQIDSAKITDVNEDCLEHIFRYLNLTDLNNVAASHAHFVSTAHRVYNIVHRHKMVIISDSGHQVTASKSNSMSTSTSMKIEMEMVNVTPATYLRNFGHLVLDLTLDYISLNGKENGHHWREIERMVFKCSLKTLFKLTLQNCQGNVMEEIREPFEKTKKLRVYGHINNDIKMIQFSKWFPNIDSLKLDNAALCSDACFKGVFRALKKIQILILAANRERNIEQTVRQLLQSHRDIKGLFIDSNFNAWLQDIFEFLSFLSQTLTHLSDLQLLHIEITPNTMTEITRNIPIHFKSVQCFNLSTHSSDRFPDDVSITFDRLKILNLYSFDGNDSKWIEFILQNRSLIELGYFPSMLRYSAINYNLFETMVDLPMLKTIALRARSFSPNAVNQLVNDCKTRTNLKQFELKSFTGSADFGVYLKAIDRNIQTLYDTNIVQSKVSRTLVIRRRDNN